MKASDVPVKFPIPFGESAGAPYIRQVPTDSQIGITDGAASLTTGFPPLNFDPVAAGGVPPFGQDINGILFQTTGWSRWIAAGATDTFDQDFSTAIGGYPKGAILRSANQLGFIFISSVDDNDIDPDTSVSSWDRLQTKLSGDTTFYVNGSTGSGANTGLSPTSAWATPNQATSFLRTLDFNGSRATVQIADGTYEGFNVETCQIGLTGAAQLVFNGNASFPANVTVGKAAAIGGGQFTIQNMTLVSSGDCLHAEYGGRIVVGAGIIFGSSGGAHMSAGRMGQIQVGASYTITGSAIYHLLSSNVGFIKSTTPITVTLTGTPNFSSFFANAGFAEIEYGGNTFSGSATGVRYSVSANGVINVGGNVNYFPGNSAGSASGGGQYL